MEAYNLDIMEDSSKLVLLNHEDGIPVPDGVSRLFDSQVDHDPSRLGDAMGLAADLTKIPVGLLYRNDDAICYDDLSAQGIGMGDDEKLAGINSALDAFAI